MDTDLLLSLIESIHTDCHKLIWKYFKTYLPVAGNIGVFCQSNEEFKTFTKIRKQLTHPSENPNQKYFTLITPITIPSTIEIPEATYTHLYIRVPDPTPYGRFRGDIDFLLPNEKYAQLKQEVRNKNLPGMQMYDRTGWDTIQLTYPDIQSVAYISTIEMAKKARVKFD